MKYPAPALAQGLDILGQIIRLGRASFGELQRATGVNANTLNRCLVTLCEMGFVEKRPDLKYTAGLRICIFEGAASVFQQMKHRARASMELLVQRYEITAILHGVQGEKMHVLDKVMSAANIAMNDIGADLTPLMEHIITPWGLVRMATARMDVAEVQPLVREAVETRDDEYDADKILALYEETLALGYCHDLCCIMPNLERIAFPVFGPDGALIGVLGIGSFRDYLSGEMLKNVIRDLRDMSAQISRWSS